LASRLTPPRSGRVQQLRNAFLWECAALSAARPGSNLWSGVS
jgi:hypothetical protein